MKYKIEEIEGIGPVVGAKLKALGIVDTDKLLERCGARKGRSEVAEETGLDESRLLKWVNAADLMRISGVGEEYSELLEAAGCSEGVKKSGTVNRAAGSRADSARLRSGACDSPPIS